MSKDEKKKVIKKKRSKKLKAQKASAALVDAIKDWNTPDAKDRLRLGSYPILPDNPKEKIIHNPRWEYRNPEYNPLTDREYEAVYKMAKLGLPLKDMGSILAFSMSTWQKLLRNNERLGSVINAGRGEGNTEILETFYDLATDKENPNMTLAAVRQRIGSGMSQPGTTVNVNTATTPNDMRNVTPEDIDNDDTQATNMITINVVSPVKDSEEIIESE